MSTDTLKGAIQQAAKEHPAWGVRKIWVQLRPEGLCASRRCIHALMRAMGHQLPASTVGCHPAFRGHVVVLESDRRWATDLTTVWTPQDGLVAVAPMAPVVDCGDRTCLAPHVSLSHGAGAILATSWKRS